MSPIEKRNIELEETLGIIVPLANHMIVNLAAAAGDEATSSPEWKAKFERWSKAWIHAEEVLTPGLLGRKPK